MDGIHSFTQQVFTEHRLCARHGFRPGRPRGLALRCVGCCPYLHPVFEEVPGDCTGPSSPSPDTLSRKFQTLSPEAVTLIAPLTSWPEGRIL